MKNPLKQMGILAATGCSLLISLCGLSAANGNEISEVSMHADVWPAMIRRADNPVVRLDIELPKASQPQKLEEVHIDLEGTGKQTIESLDILKGKANEIDGFDKPSGKSLKSIPSSMKAVISADIELVPGMNHLRITAQEAKSAPIDAALVFLPLNYRAGGKLYDVRRTNSVMQRIGYVVAQGGDKIRPHNRVSHFFRIPGLVKTNKGTLVACMDNRYDRLNDLPNDIDVGISRSLDGGKTWTPISVAMESKKAIPGIPGTGSGDAAILVDSKTGRIWIAALWANGVNPIWGPQGTNNPADKCGQFLLCYSDDDGITWSKPINITDQVKLPEWGVNFQGPGVGMTLKDGTLVFPCQFWFDENGKRKAHASIIYSKDGGKTWKCGKAACSGSSEVQGVELSDGSVMINARNENRTGHRIVYVTKNLGETWEEHPTNNNKNGKGLAEPRQACQGSIIAVPGAGGEKHPLFFSNPQFHERDRRQMMIRTSLDDGATWMEDKALLYDARYGYGYSSLAPVDDRHIGVLYEGRGTLFFLRIPYGELMPKTGN